MRRDYIAVEEIIYRFLLNIIVTDVNVVSLIRRMQPVKYMLICIHE